MSTKPMTQTTMCGSRRIKPRRPWIRLLVVAPSASAGPSVETGADPRICAFSRSSSTPVSRRRPSRSCCSSRFSAMALLPRPFDVSATPPTRTQPAIPRDTLAAPDRATPFACVGDSRAVATEHLDPRQAGRRARAPSYCLPTSSSRSLTRGVVATRCVGRRRVTPVRTTRTVWRAPLLDVTGGATLDATVGTAG
jgi:hypothetical protein